MQYNPFYYLEVPELIHYEYVWVNFIKSGILVENTIPDEIIDSWKRCRLNKVDPMIREIPQKLFLPEDVDKRIEINRELLNIATPIMELMINTIDETDLTVRIVDTDGYILSNLYKGSVVNDLDHYYRIGHKVDETVIGTNAYQIAMRYKKPIQVVGAEHYCEMFHKKGVYAAPICDTNGEIAAVIGMSVEAEKTNHFMLGMVTATARAIENEYQLYKAHGQLLQQYEEQKIVLDSVTDGIIYIDENNMITQANQEMVDMTGLQREYLVGQNAAVIPATPKINTLLTAIRKGDDVGKIQINGRGHSHKCLLNHRLVENNEAKSTKRVLFFIKYDEIQELADRVSQENRAFFSFDDIIGKSNSLQEAIELAKKAAQHNVRVIIEGESGTGKEMFAQAIHNSGSRKNGPFVAVDCGAIPRELLESELFGYEEGAYTGARKGGHRGKFETANGGTLFLDEIGNMPIDMQSKLLRVLQENRVTKIGGYLSLPIDVQVIVATNLNLIDEVKRGNFREDLFYRLNTIYIRLPSLRERRSDIPVLVNYLIKNYKNEFHKKIKGIEEEAMLVLTEYDWPGNVRQLNNVVERMMLIANKDVISMDFIPDEIKKVSPQLPASWGSKEIPDTLEEAMKRYVESVLSSFGGNIKKAAELLGVSRGTIYRILRK